VASGLPLREVLQLDDAKIDYTFLMAHRVDSKALQAAKVSIWQLKARNVSTAQELRLLGYDCLDLLDEHLCAQAVAAYGVDATVDAFLRNAYDAVVMAGSPNLSLLQIDLATLLSLCNRDSEAAYSVIAQTVPRSLKGVAAQTLVESGVLAIHLRALRFTKEIVRKQTFATESELNELGF
jgi:hypothetical protein